MPAGLQTLTSLKTLDVASPTSGEIDLIGDHLSGMGNPHPTCRLEERISKPSEFLLVSTFFSNSAFDQFKQKFGVLVDFISNTHENLKPNTLDTTSAPTTNTTISRQFRRILDDLKYIRNNIDLLESSHNATSAVELLNDLMNTHHHSFDLSELLRTVVKLKVLIPRKQVDALEKNEKRIKKKKEKEEDVTDSDSDINMNTPEMQNLSRSYDSLTYAQRNCLLYFAVFPYSSTSVSIKERILVQLWYTEGFIDPQHEDTVALGNANSTDNPQSNPNRNLILEPTADSNPNTETSAATNDTKRVYTTKGVESPNTVEEIGRKILMALQEKSFIERSRRGYGPNGWEPYTWYMESDVHSFVRTQAKAERLFGVNEGNGKLNPHFCLLTPSCKLWPNYTNSSEKLESFKTVHTLLNVNEPIIDIRVEWFSKMRNLCVLHLGRCGYDDNDDNNSIVDVLHLQFLEELKNMKQLSLFSLEGFSAIKKLPECVCKLTNLKILNLRECSYLEELPAGIGSLKNLTHLDLTDCHVLSKLPRGLSLLSKLEVLKGFVIIYHIGGQQHRDACTLRELSKLDKLRKLTLVVNTEKFPDSEDVQVFKEMKNLCNLMITWEKGYNKDQASQDVVGHKALRRSIWKQLKCWEQQTPQHETEEPSTTNPFVNLRKLVMCCFPLENAPSWLHPSGLQKLEKLYILGGELKSLPGDTNQNTWNVKRLSLRHLKNLHMDWKELRHIFSNMTYCYKLQCDIRNFPYFFEWGIEMEKANEDV